MTPSSPDHTCAPTCAPGHPGAALCPRSPTYWRREENRADGQPYREPTLEESYASLDRESRRR